MLNTCLDVCTNLGHARRPPTRSVKSSARVRGTASWAWAAAVTTRMSNPRSIIDKGQPCGIPQGRR
eukprot:7539653-Alexandrium_andersonii.AAC.1